jgi:hypothetical protein
VSIQRRDFFAILGFCAANAQRVFAQHDQHSAEAGLDLASYRPRALSPSEYELLDGLAEALLPRDETGPGAHDAHVAYFVDVVLTHGSAIMRQSWKSGLARVAAIVEERFGQQFAACSHLQRQEVLTELAKNEMMPETELDHFFVDFKQTVIDGFYASELIQREHLGYKGNTAVAEFPGCTHSNFQHPDIA